MDFTAAQFAIALPEIFLLCASCVLLLVDVFFSERCRDLTYYLTQLTLLIAFILTIPQFKAYPQATTIFNEQYILDKLAILSKLFIYLFSFFAFAYASEYNKTRDVARNEYYLLGMFAVLGMSVMASANSFLTVFLGLELLSLPLYAMVAMYKGIKDSTEAAMKYFVLGSLASGLLLYGISLLYGITGSVTLNSAVQLFYSRDQLVAVVALIFILSGLVFKFGAVPFHMWVPDVYQGASTPTTLFIASAPKVAAFAITLRILVQAVPSLHPNWEQMLTVIAILSMGFGNVLAIVQSNLKRMLAYSSVGHVGYTLLGIIAGPYSSQGYSAAMFYIVTYVLVAAGAFAVISLMSRDGVDMDKLNDYRGLNARNPWLAFMMLLLMFSMAGVPPLVGFFAKLGLLQALVQADMVWLAVVALIFALIGAYYYLRVVLLMYFEEPAEGADATPVAISPTMQVAISLNGGAALLLGILPSFLIDMCRISVG